MRIGFSPLKDELECNVSQHAATQQPRSDDQVSNRLMYFYGACAQVPIHSTVVAAKGESFCIPFVWFRPRDSSLAVQNVKPGNSLAVAGGGGGGSNGVAAASGNSKRMSGAAKPDAAPATEKYTLQGMSRASIRDSVRCGSRSYFA